jgi:hypothetical protein
VPSVRGTTANHTGMTAALTELRSLVREVKKKSKNPITETKILFSCEKIDEGYKELIEIHKK